MIWDLDWCTVFSLIVSAETILFWNWKPKGHSQSFGKFLLIYPPPDISKYYQESSVTFSTALISKFTLSPRIIQALFFSIVGKFSLAVFGLGRHTAQRVKCFKSLIRFIVFIIVVFFNVITLTYWLLSVYRWWERTFWTTDLKKEALHCKLIGKTNLNQIKSNHTYIKSNHIKLHFNCCLLWFDTILKIFDVAVKASYEFEYFYQYNVLGHWGTSKDPYGCIKAL